MFTRTPRKGALSAFAMSAFLLPAVQMCAPSPGPTPPPPPTTAPPTTIAEPTDPCPSCHDPRP